VTVTVSEFRVTGATSYPATELQALLTPWRGRKLDLAGLNDAAGAITRYYQGRGHLLTYAYVPAQRVADGAIEIAVLEGRIDGVQTVAAQDTRLRDEVVQAHTDRLSEKTPVLQADVERQMLLLNDIPGVTARAAFTPGTATGAAEIVVSVAEDEPLQLRADIDNHGSRSTGEYRAGLALSLNDLFGWGDATTVRGLVSNQGGLVSGSISTSLPVGGDGFRLGANIARLKYELGGVFASIGAVGNADSIGLDATYAVLRTAERNLNVKLGAEQKRLRDAVQAVSSGNLKRSDALDATLSFDARDTLFGTAGASAGNVVATVGRLRVLDESRRFSKGTGQFLRQQTLSGPWSLYIRAAGQYASGNLDSSEKFGLAGPYAVRAYAPGEASVDQAALLTLEARYAMEYLGGNLVWGLFYDHAEGRFSKRPAPAAANDNEVRLAGGGLSVQWNAGNVGLSASLAARGNRPARAEGGDPKARVYFQLSVTP
jgi:hemolysin activation/secretion protein